MKQPGSLEALLASHNSIMIRLEVANKSNDKPLLALLMKELAEIQSKLMLFSSNPALIEKAGAENAALSKTAPPVASSRSFHWRQFIHFQYTGGHTARSGGKASRSGPQRLQRAPGPPPRLSRHGPHQHLPRWVTLLISLCQIMHPPKREMHTT